MALTGHDTTAGHAEARQALTGHLPPVALLPGMELSCRLDGRSRGVPGEMKGSLGGRHAHQNLTPGLFRVK